MLKVNRIIGCLGWWVFVVTLGCTLRDPLPEIGTIKQTPTMTPAFSTHEELRSFLKKSHSSQDNQQQPIVSQLPKNMSELAKPQELFLDIIIPIIMVANDEVRQEQLVIKQLGTPNDHGKLSPRRQQWLQFFQQKYGTKDLKELGKRVQPTPISLVAAQAILESNWGRSRFAIQGQALFGVHATKGDPYIKARKSNVRVVKYQNLLESVRHYMLVLNKRRAFQHFRTMRQKLGEQPTKGRTLASSLHGYAAIGNQYQKRLQIIIDKYHLLDWDQGNEQPQHLAP